MLQETIFKGERALNALEMEIVEKKTEAFESALNSLVPIKILVYPYVKDFRRKLIKQKEILIETAKKVISNPDMEQKYVRKAAKDYYYNNPFHALVMLYIPRIIVPMHIQRLLKRFERRTKRFFRLRVKEFTAFLQSIQAVDLPNETPDKDYWQQVFPEDQQFTGYLRFQYENDKKTLKMLKKGANWRNFTAFDVLNSFSISFIPIYRLFSRIWKSISDSMEEYTKRKVLEFYLIDSLSTHVYNILKEKSYRFVLDETFSVSPEQFMKEIHDPAFIVRFNPQKGMNVEKLGPNGERYLAVANMILFKLNIAWDVYYRFEGLIEEWWIENSNYLDSMTGYCIYERVPEGCHYYSITVKVKPSEKLAAIGDMIIPTLEKMTKENTHTMMLNIKKYYDEKKSH